MLVKETGYHEIWMNIAIYCVTNSMAQSPPSDAEGRKAIPEHPSFLLPKVEGRFFKELRLIHIF